MVRKHLIFVSSTYLDLIEERKSIAMSLSQNGCIPVGMELFPSENRKLLQVIKEHIDISDYYIVIIGNRYGSIDKKLKCSYTEFELRYALKKRKKPLVFIGTNEFNKTKPDADNIDKMEYFKRFIGENFTPAYFSSINELNVCVLTSLNNQINKYPSQGLIPANLPDLVKVHLDQFERTKFYRSIVKTAKKDIFIFGTTLAHVSKDKKGLEVKLAEGVNIRVLGLDPNYVEDKWRIQTFNSFFNTAVSITDDNSFDIRVRNSFNAVLKLKDYMTTKNLKGKFEYRVYSFFPTSNMTVVDGGTKNGRMVFEHILVGNKRITFPDLIWNNILFKTVLDEFEEYWNFAKRIF